MSDDRPSAFSDVRKGLGLLFRAARTTVAKLPKKDLEESLVTGAREVGQEVLRAFENVASTARTEAVRGVRAIEREVLGKKGDGPVTRDPSNRDVEPRRRPVARAAEPVGGDVRVRADFG
jgi:hypothetical protein